MLKAESEVWPQSVSPAAPPGVHTEPQQRSESSYSKQAGRPTVTHPDDSRTSIMFKTRQSEQLVCAENIPENRKKNFQEEEISDSESEQKNATRLRCQTYF